MLIKIITLVFFSVASFFLGFKWGSTVVLGKLWNLLKEQGFSKEEIGKVFVKLSTCSPVVEPYEDEKDEE